MVAFLCSMNLSLSLSDPNLFLAAFNNSFFENPDAVLPTKTFFFRLFFLRFLGLIANAFSNMNDLIRLDQDQGL